MASRPIFTPHSVITSQSMGASVTSDITIIQNLSMVSYELNWSAGSTPVGLAEVQVSNTYSQNGDGTVKNAGSWTTIASSAVSGNSGTGFFDIDAIASYAIRLKYTRTSGSGTLNAVIAGKAT